MLKASIAKSAELQMLTWFFQSAWELFSPVADLYRTDVAFAIQKYSNCLRFRSNINCPAIRICQFKTDVSDDLEILVKRKGIRVRIAMTGTGVEMTREGW